MSNSHLVTDRMGALLSQWQQSGDQRSIFLNCYYLMTCNMVSAVEAGEFQDSRWVSGLLEHFADYYFHALEAYEQSLPTTPVVWQRTFDAAINPHTGVMQNLMLGINAHINYDLVFAVADMLDPEWQALSPAQRESRYHDHCQVNMVISRTVDAVQDTVVERLSPGMELVDRALGPLDEWLASRMITHFRDRVWRQAVNRVETPLPEEREALRYGVEQVSVHRAELILVDDLSSAIKDLIENLSDD